MLSIQTLNLLDFARNIRSIVNDFFHSDIVSKRVNESMPAGNKAQSVYALLTQF
jgi:hypothetical protein